MFLLIPGCLGPALGAMFAALVSLLLGPAVIPNFNPNGTFLTLTAQQWGIVFLIMAL
ncbi:MAG TPA: hypothetical protein VEG44_02640 [Candidatus Acidoferrales bacterium]|nr:hypothetical protein [Candidatus Acidoferrales bacterium]